MSPEQIANAKDAVRALVAADVARLFEPTLRPEHVRVVEAIERLPWGAKPLDVVAVAAEKILKRAERPGGTIAPAEDEADVPWAMFLLKLTGCPTVGSRAARRWFANLERSLQYDISVSPVVMGVSAYTVARFEDALGHEFEVWWWLQMAVNQTEHDERHGLALAVVLRAATLLAGEPR